MQTSLLGGSLFGLLFAAVPAQATFIKARLPITEMVGGADLIIIGKVAAIDKKLVQALPTAGARKKEHYQIVEVTVQDTLLGPKGLTSIKMGVQCFSINTLRGPRKLSPGVTWTEGEEACLLLKRHPTASFYEAGFQDVLRQKDALAANAHYQEDLDLTRRCVKLLAEPDKGLTSGKAEDRLLTVALLIRKYRGPAPGPFDKGSGKKTPKQEPIAAEQSKRILHVLEDADWSLAREPMPSFTHPASLFRRLALTSRDGWNLKQRPVSPLDGRAGYQAHQELTRAAKKWLKTHADTYRIKRLVDDRADNADAAADKARRDEEKRLARQRPKKDKADAEHPEKPSEGDDSLRANAKLKLIRMLIDDGKTDRARVRLKELIKSYPDTDAAAEARKLLKKLD